MRQGLKEGLHLPSVKSVPVRHARRRALPGRRRHLAADIVKCRLKPVSRQDCDVPFSSAQWARLKAIFPTGVCDWSKKGVEQHDLAGTWIGSGN